jgi:hypothetical protein
MKKKRKTQLPCNPNLYRCQLTCQIGMDCAGGKKTAPTGVPMYNWIFHLIFSAIADLALYLADKDAKK